MKIKKTRSEVLHNEEHSLPSWRLSSDRGDPTRKDNSRKIILVVDDNLEFLTVISQLLTCDGYTVLKADSAESAMPLWKEQAHFIDLVIADVVLPGMTGLELVDFFREQRPELEVIVMSGFLPEMLRACIKPLNSTAFLEKPFSAQVLRDTVHARLSCASN